MLTNLWRSSGPVENLWKSSGIAAMKFLSLFSLSNQVLFLSLTVFWGLNTCWMILNKILYSFKLSLSLSPYSLSNSLSPVILSLSLFLYLCILNILKEEWYFIWLWELVPISLSLSLSIFLYYLLLQIFFSPPFLSPPSFFSF